MSVLDLTTSITTHLKVCGKCREAKHPGAFGKHRGMSDGLQNRCKSCEREYREANIEKFKEKDRNRYNKKKAEILVKNRDYYWAHKAEIRRQRAGRRQANISQFKDRDRRYRQENPERVRYGDRKKSLWTRFKMTPEEYHHLHELQGGCCAICGRRHDEYSSELAVDHCHVTGVNRGLLCILCNVALGFFGDNVARMKSAIGYLSHYPGVPCRGPDAGGPMSQLREVSRRKWTEKRSRIFREYGLTPTQYDSMFLSQDYRCAICADGGAGSRIRLCVDHCHSYGRVRGLLCHECNAGVGNFRDDPHILQKAHDYVTRHAIGIISC